MEIEISDITAWKRRGEQPLQKFKAVLRKICKGRRVSRYHRNEMKTDTVGVIPAVSVFTYLFSGCYSWA